MIVLDNDLSTVGQDAYELTPEGETLIVNADLTAARAPGDGFELYAGLHVLDTADGATISIHGRLSGTGRSAMYGFYNEADDVHLDIGADGTLTGYSALGSVGQNLSIVNYGLIQSMTSAIASNGLNLINYGTILGDGGVYAPDAGHHQIINYGSLGVYNKAGNNPGSDSAAIEFGDGADDVYNAGTITGDIQLGGGADTYDGRRGTLVGSGSPDHQDAVVYGGAGTDTLRGGAGRDLLKGEADADVLEGNGGNDVLDGGAGADTMSGGAGNDSYYVDTSGEAGTDKIVEAAGQGTDTVYASASFTLAFADNVESLVLLGSGNLEGRGNALANTITGNAGVDTLYGGDGNDTYILQNASDTVVESAGKAAGTSDTILSSVTHILEDNVENLTLTGTGAIDGTGNGQLNVIVGNVASNVIDGGLGNDILKGGSGIDTFVFSTALGPSNVDRLVDFYVGKEKIHLDHDVFSALAVGPLDPTQFKDITNVKGDADDHILYNSAKGALYYDPDGYNGAVKPILFALLDTHPTNLSAADFLVV